MYGGGVRAEKSRGAILPHPVKFHRDRQPGGGPFNPAGPDEGNRMALTMNMCVVLGYVGQDPTRYEASDSTIFTVATNEPKKDSDESITSWFSCIAWGKNAQAIATKVRKGDLIHIQGRLRQSEYTDRENVVRRVLEFHVQRWSMIQEVKRVR